jgi:iron complex outermembrane receptor protein
LVTVSAVSLLAGAASAQTATPAGASSSDAMVIDELVVTAQKREENVQDVPIAITVVGGKQLERQQINTVTDLRRTAPSLEFAPPGQSPGNGGFVRGLGTTVSTATAESSVGLVVDGVPQGNVATSSIFDVQRVEVLRGPQGTLFGQSVSAGLINMTTNAPSFSGVSGMVQTELADDGVLGSQYDRRIVRGVVNLPLAENAAVRISGHYDWINGVTDNKAVEGGGSQRDDRGVRARLLWEPTSDVTVNLIADYNKIDTGNSPYFTFLKVPAGSSLETLLASCGIVASASNRDTCSPTHSFENNTNYGFSGEVDWTLGDFTLTSISAYRRNDYKSAFSIDGLPTTAPVKISFGPSDNDQNQVSQEFRLTSPTGEKLRYVVGAYASQLKGDYAYINNLQLSFLPVPIPSSTTSHPDVQNAALFGQVDYSATDALRVFGGLRLTHVSVASPFINNLTGIAYSAKVKDDNLSGRIGAQYDVTSSVMAYATASRGYKGPTFNDADLNSNPIAVKAEIPTALEVGLKGDLFDKRLNFDANLFHTKVKDYQAQVCVNDAVRGIVCTTENIANVTSKGFELGVFGRPMTGLSLNSGLIYAKAVYPKGYLGGDGTDLSGAQLANTAKWKFVLSGEYEHALTEGYKGFVSGDAIWRSATRLTTSADPEISYHEHWMLGGRVGVRSQDDKYELALFARNLTNEHEPTLRYVSPLGAGAYTQFLSDASFRVVGLALTAKF